MASKIDRIATLLAQGIAPAQVASITGVTPSYISQLRSDPEFVDYIASLKEEAGNKEVSPMEELAVFSDTLLATEHQVVAHLKERLPYMEDRVAIQMLKEVGARSDSIRKTAAISSLVANPGMATVRLVEITMPACAVPDIQFGANNEIVAIGSRSIAPMATQALHSLINSTRPSKDNDIIEEADYETYSTESSEAVNA